MEMFVVQGGRPLRGSVAVSGSKNASLPIMAASLLANGTTTLKNVPDLADVRCMKNLLSTLGVTVENSTDAITLNAVDESIHLADYEIVRKMRASFCVLGPLLAKRKRAIVSLPGGCNIGHRPIDLHLKGLEALGAKIRVERGYVIAEAEQLQGATVSLSGPFGSTATGTCNVMAAATLAVGATVIHEAACEPEVVDLGEYLIKMGAKIDGLGTPVLKIDGVKELNGCEYEVIPDRIEAATLMIAGAITGGELILENVPMDQLISVVEKLKQIGVEIESVDTTLNSVRVSCPGSLQAAESVAQPYPGIPTDVQAQLMALLICTPGISVVTDKVFPDRFMHTSELIRMGAKIRREADSAIITGGQKLSGANVMASDLRASAALVLAALNIADTSVIRRIYHLDRGYEKLDEKLNRLGANIQRVKDCPENDPLHQGLLDEAHELKSPLISKIALPDSNRIPDVI